ncbi:MAG: hypothetical protein IMF15_00715 [Proteobacteria bacterium]|nr:hypothetical protein [Pseudomonadota bacterium]
MRTFNKLSIFGITVLMAASIGAARADEGDVTQTRTQERTRMEFNLQTPTADFGQAQNREEHTVMNQNQNQYQYKYQHQNKYQNKYQNGGSGSADSSMKSANREGSTWQGNNTASSRDRMSATNRHMQGSSAAGSMNRQSAASRSTGGGRR